MTVAELLKKKRTISFEVYPPKDGAPLDGIRETISRLREFRPDFFSCTFGAGGSGRGKERNLAVCDVISESGSLAVPHLTCIGSGREEIREIARDYAKRGLSNVLALRGDIPAGQEGAGGGFARADELAAFLRAEFPELCVGCAGYPEKHLAAASMESDIACLRSKQDSGASFVVTQLCYDVPAFERFLERARKAGVTIPVVAGIMPALVYDPTVRMAISNGCSIPAELAAILGKHRDDPAALAEAGTEHAAALARRYLAAGADGLHLYTLNKWKRIAAIMEAAGLSGREGADFSRSAPG